MAREELGTKRICKSCGTKFYDLNRAPIICPACQAVFELKTDMGEEGINTKDNADDTPDSIELVSLDKADVSEDLDVENNNINIDDSDDDTFLAVDEDDENVSDLIVSNQDDNDD